MSNRRSKKKFRDESLSPTPSPEPEDIRVLFYIPASGINLEVLLFYIKIYLGDDSDAEPGHRPGPKVECTHPHIASSLTSIRVRIGRLDSLSDPNMD
jgi:hypothetical protein